MVWNPLGRFAFGMIVKLAEARGARARIKGTLRGSETIAASPLDQWPGATARYRSRVTRFRRRSSRPLMVRTVGGFPAVTVNPSM